MKLTLTSYWVSQKVHFVFFYKMALVVLIDFNFIWNNFLRLYCDSCHISVHLKKTQKLVNFVWQF